MENHQNNTSFEQKKLVHTLNWDLQASRFILDLRNNDYKFHTPHNYKIQQSLDKAQKLH